MLLDSESDLLNHVVIPGVDDHGLGLVGLPGPIGMHARLVLFAEAFRLALDARDPFHLGERELVVVRERLAIFKERLVDRLNARSSLLDDV